MSVEIRKFHFTGGVLTSLFSLPASCYFMNIPHMYLWFCSRVVDAQSPVAVVIPIRDSSFSRELRIGDISWHDFLKRAEGSK